MSTRHWFFYIVIILLVVAGVVLGGLGQLGPMQPRVAEFSEYCSTADVATAMVKPIGTSEDEVGLFGLWHRTFELSSVGNAFDFTTNAHVFEFLSPSGQLYEVDAFYVGKWPQAIAGKWQLRFMPNEVGQWRYQQKVQAAQGQQIIQGRFTVNKDAMIAPVIIDPDFPTKLIDLNNKPVNMIGSKWFSPIEMLPCDYRAIDSFFQKEQGVDQQVLLQYLDELVAYDHDAVLVKLSLFPLMDDGISWDALWLAKLDWFISQAQRRGIYVQLTLFDTWSRQKYTKARFTTLGSNHVFNVWEPNDQELKLIDNYLRYVVARFAAFSNIMWEIGNEMEHTNCGDCFIAMANDRYLPFLRQLDPYHRLIGLSENVWRNADVDIGFLHQTYRREFTNFQADRPVMLNEMVFSDDTPPLWDNRVARNPENRFAYRRSFWRMFAVGGVGSFEATWLDLSEPIDDAVRAVMADHQRLAEFIGALNGNINQRKSVDGVIISDQDHYPFQLQSSFYSYFIFSGTDSAIIELNLPPGDYEIQWYSPTTGQRSAAKTLTSSGDILKADYTGDERDAVLMLKRLE